MNELALFSGAGGGILGGHLLGWRTVCAVEWEPYPASVLCARQNDGFLAPFPIWDDVQTFDGKPWRGIVDVISGGFPCQDISVAGKGDGLDGERSGMWKQMARIIGEVRPKYVFVENSPMLTSRGLDRVLGDLSEMGFDAKWGIIGADYVGAPHRRERFWLVAYSNSIRSIQRQHQGNRVQKQKNNQNQPNHRNRIWSEADRLLSLDKWSEFTTNLCRMDDGLASRVDRLKAIGNGQVSRVAATAWNLLNT
jgi:DNA (cytosine-5)-methyltransferase 1